MQQRRQDGEDRQGAYTAVVLLLPLVVISLTGLIAPHLPSAHRRRLPRGVARYLYGFDWLPTPHASAYLWLLVIAVHVVNHVRRAPRLAVADWQDQLRGATTRRGLVLGSLVLGAALAVAMLPYPSPFTAQGG